MEKHQSHFAKILKLDKGQKTVPKTLLINTL